LHAGLPRDVGLWASVVFVTARRGVRARLHSMSSEESDGTAKKACGPAELGMFATVTPVTPVSAAGGSLPC